MNAADFLRIDVDPGLAWCAALPGWNVPSDDRDRVLLVAIGGQESGFRTRVQAGNGPAHSFFQDEKNGGVRGVLTSPVTAKMAKLACDMAYVEPDAEKVWELFATEKGDLLAVAFARLLLRSDRAPLPALGQRQLAADYYRRNWRPGKYRPADWPANYDAAMAAVAAAPIAQPP